MMKLHPYQSEAVDFLLDPELERWKILSLPTGSGKTEVLKAAIGRAQAKGWIKGAVLATTQLHIEAAFSVPAIYSHYGKTVKSPDWVLVREEDCVQDAFDQLPGSALLTLHCNLVRYHDKLRSILRKPLIGYVLVLDEAHHLGEGTDQLGTKIYEFAREWHRAGGTVWSATATPYRSDGSAIAPRGEFDLFVRGWSELAAKGYLPSKVKVRVLELGHDVLPSPLPDSDWKQIIDYVDRQGINAVVRVRAGDKSLGMDAESEAWRLVTLWAKAGTPAYQPGSSVPGVLHAVGPNRAQVVKDALAEDRAARQAGGYAVRKIQHIVHCSRFLEGADSDTAGHVVNIGALSELLPAIQSVGRALRKKVDPDYPEQWRDEVLFTMVVPRLLRKRPNRNQEWDYTAQDHTRVLLLIACYFEGAPCAGEYAAFWRDLVQGFRVPPMSVQSRRKVERGLSALGVKSPDEEARARAFLFEVVAGAAVDEGVDHPTLAAVLQRLKRMGQLTGENLKQLLEEAAHGQDPTDERKLELQELYAGPIMGAVQDALDQGKVDQIKEAYDTALLDELLALCNKWGKLTVSYAGRVLSGFEGTLVAKNVKRIVRDMIQSRRLSVDKALTWDVIDYVLRRYQQDYKGVLPIVGGTAPQDLSLYLGFNYTVGDLDQLLRQRYGLNIRAVYRMSSYGWITGPTIRTELLAAIPNSLLKVDLTDYWSDGEAVYRAKHEKRFATSAGNLVELTLAARYGWRGLPGKRKLSEVVEWAASQALEVPRG